jgi:glycosyl-4,4'-diaponeurosporenoate acyltransferase
VAQDACESVGVRLPVLVAVDLVAWLGVHLGAGYLVHRLPEAPLDHGGWLFRERAWERGGRFYADVLRIRRWKRWLPEGGDFFPGGFNKAALASLDEAYFRRYARETRRAELGHLLTALPAPLFFVWNPWYLGVLMQLYALVANGPCIASQRYNRLRLERVLARRAATASLAR